MTYAPSGQRKFIFIPCKAPGPRPAGRPSRAAGGHRLRRAGRQYILPHRRRARKPLARPKPADGGLASPLRGSNLPTAGSQAPCEAQICRRRARKPLARLKTADGGLASGLRGSNLPTESSQAPCEAQIRQRDARKGLATFSSTNENVSGGPQYSLPRMRMFREPRDILAHE